MKCVADRLIQAVCQLDYPRHLLEIQVLDDSSDETRDIAAQSVERQAERGFDITYRTAPTGAGKAGALEAGLREANGESIAIFDADFIPPPSSCVRRCRTSPTTKSGWCRRAGAISTRTTHSSRRFRPSCSTPTSSSSTAAATAPAAFSISTCRHLAPRRDRRGGRLAARHADRGSGLELPRATRRLALRFLPDLVAPAEVPVEMNSFKSQQHRWAKGSIQTCRKLLPRILQSDLPLAVKAEAFFHLSANFNYLLMALLSVLMFPAMWVRYNMGWYEMLLIDVPLFLAATASIANFYMVSQREIYPDWKTRLKYLPFLMSIGIGLAVNNTRAVIEALMGTETEFARTPIRRHQVSDEWVGKKYRQATVVQPMIELALGLYFTATVFYALANEIYGTLPFLMLFQVGFLYTGLVSLVQQCAGDDVMLKSPEIAK